MNIYDKSSAGALWEIVSPLLAFGKELPIYKEVMDEDENDVPASYLLIRRDIADNGKIHGDGQTLYRKSSCDLILVSKSKGKNSGDIHNINIERIKEVLERGEIAYEGHNLGYNEAQKQSEYSWSVELIYG